ncbi:MAG: hypothetical protein ACYDAQ_08015 [Mycobacteriales bacterium]
MRGSRWGGGLAIMLLVGGGMGTAYAGTPPRITGGCARSFATSTLTRLACSFRIDAASTSYWVSAGVEPVGLDTGGVHVTLTFPGGTIGQLGCAAAAPPHTVSGCGAAESSGPVAKGTVFTCTAQVVGRGGIDCGVQR